jgi:predicted O-methyltransferase YrrM
MRTLEALCDVELPWSDWSMLPEAIATIVGELEAHRRTNVVELGSGVSTVYIAAQLWQIGGRVRAVEHNADWAPVIQDRLDVAGLGGHAELVMAPLEHCDLALDDTPWYGPAALAPLRDEPIDALIVDGPPGGPERPLSRYPALPYFVDALSPNALVVLDDVGRPGEQEIVERWESEYGLRFERLTDRRLALAVGDQG